MKEVAKIIIKISKYIMSWKCDGGAGNDRRERENYTIIIYTWNKIIRLIIKQ